jgi:hypothetical protein
MFNNDKTVLYFLLGKVFCRNFFGKKTETFSFDWTPETLKDVFKKIKLKMKGSQVKIILGNDLSSVLTLKLAKEDTSPAGVALEIKKFMLGQIDQSNFKYEIKGQDGSGQNIVQIFAVDYDLLKTFSESAKIASVRIEFIVPISLVLVEATKSEKKTLLFWEGEEKIALISNKKTVYISDKVTVEPRMAAKELTTMVKENFGFEPEVYMAYWPEKLVLGALSVNDIKIDVFSLTSNLRAD